MSKIRITPRGKNVLVKPDDSKKRETEGGILIPTNVEQEQKSIGTVVAVGPEAEVKDIVIGDRVMYGTYAGETIKVNEGGKEVEYKLLYDEDVLAFVTTT